MKISEKQIMELLIVGSQLSNVVLSEDPVISEMKNAAQFFAEIVDDIMSSQSNKLKEVE